MATQENITVDRRKESVARVRLVPGTGNITINGRTMDVYFGRETSKMILVEPLKLVDQMGKLDVFVNAKGGGLSGQAGAIRTRATDSLRRPTVMFACVAIIAFLTGAPRASAPRAGACRPRTP